MERNSPGPDRRPPVWPTTAAWLLAAAVAALLLDAFARGASWTEAQALRHSAAILALFGVGFVLSSHFPEHSIICRYLVYSARRAFRWYETSGLITGGRPRAAGWLCLCLAGLVAAGSFFV
ncbi:MAG: hypothetical protein ACREQZ_01275 [Woeseiaceae bacterium]